MQNDGRICTTRNATCRAPPGSNYASTALYWASTAPAPRHTRLPSTGICAQLAQYLAASPHLAPCAVAPFAPNKNHHNNNVKGATPGTPTRTPATPHPPLATRHTRSPSTGICAQLAQCPTASPHLAPCAVAPFAPNKNHHNNVVKSWDSNPYTCITFHLISNPDFLPYTLI